MKEVEDYSVPVVERKGENSGTERAKEDKKGKGMKNESVYLRRNNNLKAP